MKIVQVLDYFTDGNGVANCAKMYYRMTKKLGMESAIVARLIDKNKGLDIKNLAYLDELGQEDIVMYHMCIGTPLNEMICSYPFWKVLVYQNITPPGLIERYDPVVAKACREGLKQLDIMRQSFHVCLVLSAYNKQDLIRHGYQKAFISVIPPFADSHTHAKLPDKKMMRTYGDGRTNIVFVGRISPNKKQEDLIRMFWYYKSYLDADARLILAGGGSGRYYEKLLQYTQRLRLKDVVFTNQISEAQLRAVYETAAVFVCLSEHEGYCMPLVEAMSFGIPVIAYDSSAVAGTMGGAGILLKDKNPALVAKTVHAVCTDAGLRERIQKRQAQYLKELSFDVVFDTFQNWVRPLPKILRQASAEKEAEASKNRNPYNVVMVVKAEDWKLARRNLSYIRRYLKPGQIVMISSAKMRTMLRPEDDVVFLDEDRLYPGLTLEAVRAFFSTRQMVASQAGWYLQQFLKLAYAYVCKEEYYLVWDADTIPLREIPMTDAQTGRPYFDMKPEYIRSYFTTIHRLTGMEKAETESFIAEHMLFRTQIVKQMLAWIETTTIPGSAFFEKILFAADYSQKDRSFSEFELYGTYCSYVWPGLYKKRHLRTMRCGKMFLGAHPKKEVLQWAAQKKDLISFEHPQQVIARSRKLAHSEAFRKKYSVDDLIRRIYLSDMLTAPGWLEKEKRALQMDYPWARQPAWIQSEDYKKQKKRYAKIKREKGNGRIAVIGSSEECYLTALLLAQTERRVTILDSDFTPEKIKRFKKYWGFQVLFRRAYKNNLEIVNHLTDKKYISHLFVSSAQYEPYKKQLHTFDSIQYIMILEQGNASKAEFADQKWSEQKEPCKDTRMAVIDTFFLQADALTGIDHKSWIGLYDHGGPDGAAALFEDRIRMETYEDWEKFWDDVRRMRGFCGELRQLTQKYNVSQEQMNQLCGGLYFERT